LDRRGKKGWKKKETVRGAPAKDEHGGEEEGLEGAFFLKTAYISRNPDRKWGSREKDGGWRDSNAMVRKKRKIRRMFSCMLLSSDFTSFLLQ